MPLGPIPAPEPSSSFSMSLIAPTDEFGTELNFNTYPVNWGATPEQFKDRVQELIDQLHEALSPLGWTVSAQEGGSWSRAFTPTEADLDE